MDISSDLIQVTLHLVFSVFLIWTASVYMLRTRDMLLFTPFALFGISAAFTAGFVFYRMFSDSVWLVVELMGILILFLLLIILLQYDRNH